MKWEVQVSGDAFDLRELAKSLTNEDLRIIEREGHFFLKTIQLSELTTSEEVTAIMSNLLPILTGATRLSLGGRTPIQIVNIVQVNEDGTRNIFCSISDTIHLRDATSLEKKRPDESIEVVNLTNKVPDWINAALENTAKF